MIKVILSKFGYKDTIFKNGEYIHTCKKNIARFQQRRLENKIRQYDNESRVVLGTGMFFVRTKININNQNQ